MKKVLITGANGFLGTHLIEKCIAAGYAVSILIRATAKLSISISTNVQTFYGHIDNLDDVLNAVKDHDYVIHAASVTAQFNIDADVYEKINITATKHIVTACKKYNVEKLIYVSTANTIAPGSKAIPGTELNGFSLFKANSGYINTKYIAQQFVIEQAIQNNLPAIVVNPTFMIGPLDAKPSSGQLLLYGLNKRILLFPSGGKNFVHIQDVCNGILKALKVGIIGEKYLLAGENLSYKEFFTLVNKVAQQKPIMIQIPKILLQLGGYLGTFVQSAFKKPMKLNKSTSYMLCLNNYYSGKKSEQQLNLQYQNTRKAIAEAYDWFASQKYC